MFAQVLGYFIECDVDFFQTNIGFAPLKHDISIGDSPLHDVNFQGSMLQNSHFGRKTIRIDFRPQIWDKVPPKKLIEIYLGIRTIIMYFNAF
jgi:hypothetical protein